ncbi:MAG: hypothetical protein RIS94_2314, partial [Pseudomonadota bacterium]
RDLSAAFGLRVGVKLIQTELFDAQAIHELSGLSLDRLANPFTGWSAAHGGAANGPFLSVYALFQALVFVLALAVGSITAVRFESGGREHVVTGDLFVLGANAIHSPAILLRSGIDHGPTGQGLHEAYGIEVEAMLDGVDNFDGSTITTGADYGAYDGAFRSQSGAALLYFENRWKFGLRPEPGRWRQTLPIVIVVEDLREVHLGDFEHTFYDHAEARHPAILRMVTDESWEAIPNAEQGPDFAARVRRGMDELLAALAPGETAALFTHAGTIGEICRQATGSRAFAFMGVENASISRLVILADGTWKLRTFNEVAHL